ncbi:sugar transporter [uncultured Tateyamaria sp.]|uniref:sugar transporter n=1 Tax=uncultured Tateyamaria sp. TaxID=455651 RepID=UPI00263027DD|nr:sugar transporter [uncultured Tateyamaria sp.]
MLHEQPAREETHEPQARLNDGNDQGAGPGKGPGQGGGKGSNRRPPQPAVVNVRPIAEPAGMRRRHWGLLFSFLLLVLLPLVVAAYYLFAIAEDQFGSITGFTVRSEESGGATDILGGLAQFAGTNTSSDGNVLNEFIQSQEIVEAIDAEVDLRAHYAQHWGNDPVFSLWPDASIEDLLWYWERVVRISFDEGSGLIDVQVLAFDPDMATAIAQLIVNESQVRINDLNAQARTDAMRYANEELQVAIARLKEAREALTRFRTRTQIVDPESDIQGRMGVMNNLQQQLAEALVEQDLLLATITSETDLRIIQGQRRINVIRDRIAAEREAFASDSGEIGAVGEDYPTLITEFESLTVDREVAEETYRAALTALDVARANASRQSRYLATYVSPTRAQDAEFPQRFVLIGLIALFLVLAWAVMALVYYSIRDRS